jgi:hypothetical protein
MSDLLEDATEIGLLAAAAFFVVDLFGPSAVGQAAGEAGAAAGKAAVQVASGVVQGAARQLGPYATTAVGAAAAGLGAYGIYRRTRRPPPPPPPSVTVQIPPATAPVPAQSSAEAAQGLLAQMRGEASSGVAWSRTELMALGRYLNQGVVGVSTVLGTLGADAVRLVPNLGAMGLSPALYATLLAALVAAGLAVAVA